MSNNYALAGVTPGGRARAGAQGNKVVQRKQRKSHLKANPEPAERAAMATPVARVEAPAAMVEPHPNKRAPAVETAKPRARCGVLCWPANCNLLAVVAP